MTDEELARCSAARAADAAEHGAPRTSAASIGVVAVDGDTYVGSATVELERGRASKDGWGYLADLFVEKAYRGRGLGARLLGRVEARAAVLGAGLIRTQTASFEAPAFYTKLGYEVCYELVDYHPAGHGVVGFRKTLTPTSGPDAPELGGIRLLDRAMTDAERARMNAGFDEHGLSFGCPPETRERHGLVAYRGGALVGCVSGLATTFDGVYAQWFRLTDLFVDAPGRNQGIGTALMDRVERRVAGLGVANVWVRIAGHESRRFFQARGYEVLCEFENQHGPGNDSLFLNKVLS